MRKILIKNLNKNLRKKRSRAKFLGTSEAPRLSIFRSNKYTYAQLIDDASGKTLVSASSFSMKDKKSKKTDAAKSVGVLIGEAAKKIGIKRVVFHRGPYRFHGRVAAVALGVKASGIKI